LITRDEKAPADILIADDDAQTRSLLRLFLEGQGFRCAEAEDGRQAVSLARAAPPRCLLLDLRMPGLDGFTVARSLRSDARTRGIHIHCLSGLPAAEVQEQARRAGCEEFLTKPVDAEALLEVVRRQVGPSRPGWVTGLSLTQAQNLLDWLENHGCTGVELCHQQAEGFAVRCACPPGFRLARDAGGSVRLVEG
jgi:CheY-like chemotaxis protein